MLNPEPYILAYFQTIMIIKLFEFHLVDPEHYGKD